MIYNFNRGIGWASSGVEYAQAYRGTVLRNAGIPCRFIYTDMFRGDNIALMTENIGIPDEEVIWLYQYFTDFAVAGPSVSIAQFEQEMLLGSAKGTEAYQVQEGPGRREYCFADGIQKVYAYYVPGNRRIIQKADFYCKGRLTHAEYYSYGRIFTEYFADKGGKLVLFLRRFYNEDGSIAYEEHMDGERQIFRMKDKILYSKQELICEMVRSLPYEPGDVIILDRSTELGQPVLRCSGNVPKLCVIHAEHYDGPATTETDILWNNFYEYPFDQADRFAAFVASTEKQAQLLRAQFRKYRKNVPGIEAIPVGNLKKLQMPEKQRRPHSLCTASRLAAEKHIDLLVRAVALARRNVRDLTLDIYGKGGLEQELRELIADEKAESYIRLMGQQDMTHVYAEYSGYIAASFSEGFGLSLMEATGSGLAMIGFDVPYGNSTFIANEENGYLLPFSREDQVDARVQALARAIIRLFTEADLEAFHQKSYAIASEFLEEKVALRWKKLFEKLAAEGENRPDSSRD